MKFATENTQNFKSQIKEYISNPENLTYELKKKKKDLIFWAGIILSCLLIFIFISSKDFSFLLVLSAMFQLFSFIVVLFKIQVNKNVNGISFNSMVCFMVAIISRLCSTLFYEEYLPYDSAGDWFYQLCELFTFFSIALILYNFKLHSNDFSDLEYDKIDYKYLLVPCIFISFIFHSALNGNIFTDIAWSLSIYLESVAIYPQLYLFQSKSGKIESHTSHYVSLQGLVRILSICFWYSSYEELNVEMDNSYSLLHSYTGFALLSAQVIQLLMMCDFYYYYFKSLFRGENMSISTNL